MSQQNHHRLLHAMCQEGKRQFEYSDYHYSITGVFCLWSLVSIFVCFYQDVNEPGSLHFGVHVSNLTSKANPVPKVLEILLMHVEINGLYSEGIYRKSGSTCRARELHQILETSKSLLLDCSWFKNAPRNVSGTWCRQPQFNGQVQIPHRTFFLFPFASMLVFTSLVWSMPY